MREEERKMLFFCLFKFLCIFSIKKKKRLLFVFFCLMLCKSLMDSFQADFNFFFSPFFWKQQISGNILFYFFKQDSGSHEEVKCGTLKQASKKVKWLFTFWLWRIHWKQNEACWCENVGYITELIVNYSYKALRHTVLGPTGVNLCMVLYLTIREMCSYIIVLKM